MSRTIVFRRQARTEYDAAADWYESRRSGLGAEFTRAVQQVLDQILIQPDSYAVVWNTVREAIVPRYPYCVYFQVELDDVLVLAIIHTARDPSLWQSRD